MNCRGAPGPAATLDRMTSSDLPDAASAVVTVSDPGELIAATPVLLGFAPRSSLVAMALGGPSGGRLGLTLRIDLPPPEHTAAAAEAVVRGLLLDDPRGVVVLVVGPGGDAGPPAGELVAQVVAGLEARAIDVPLALWAESTRRGSRWSCYDACGCTGTVPGAAETPLAVAVRTEGRVVLDDRSDLERLVTPADEGRIRRREALLVAEIDAAVGDGSGPRSGDGVVEGIAALDAALDAVAASISPSTAPGGTAPGGTGPGGTGPGGTGPGGTGPGGTLPGEAGPVLTDEQVLAVAWALSTPAARDRAIAACTGSRPAVAEALWALLAREMPDPEAAEPAALLALSALLRGDGALANVALDRAEVAWPGHGFTAMLRDLARTGTRPGELRACLAGRPTPLDAG